MSFYHQSSTERYVKDIFQWMVPFLHRCEGQEEGAAKSLLREYLVSLAQRDLTLPLVIFQHSKPDVSVPTRTQTRVYGASHLDNHSAHIHTHTHSGCLCHVRASVVSLYCKCYIYDPIRAQPRTGLLAIRKHAPHTHKQKKKIQYLSVYVQKDYRVSHALIHTLSSPLLQCQQKIIGDPDQLMAVALECIYSCERDDQLSLCYDILECLPQRGYGSDTHTHSWSHACLHITSNTEIYLDYVNHDMKMVK